MMNLIETLYLGTPDDGSVAEPPYCATMHWCGHTIPFTAPTINNLSRHFIEAERLHQEKLMDEPYRLACVIPTHFAYGRKYKPKDELSIYDTWKWYVENMLPPKNGMVVSIYSSPMPDHTIDTVWSCQFLWRTKEIWSEENCSKNLLTYQVPESGGVDFKKSDRCYEMCEELVKWGRENGFRVMPISYATNINATYQLLLKTRMHFGYTGGTYFTAGLTRTPTIGFGLKRRPFDAIWPELVHAAERKREYDDNGEIIYKSTQDLKKPVNGSFWGQGVPNPGHMLRWVDDEVGTRNRPVEFQYYTDDSADLMETLESFL